MITAKTIMFAAVAKRGPKTASKLQYPLALTVLLRIIYWDLKLLAAKQVYFPDTAASFDDHCMSLSG